MKVLNRKQMKKSFPNNLAHYPRTSKYFVLDTGITAFANINELRQHLLILEANRQYLKQSTMMINKYEWR